MTKRSYPQPFPAILRKGCGIMAMDNSPARTTNEESEHPPLTSCSQMTLHSRTEKADNSFATKPDKPVASLINVTEEGLLADNVAS